MPALLSLFVSLYVAAKSWIFSGFGKLRLEVLNVINAKVTLLFFGAGNHFQSRILLPPVNSGTPKAKLHLTINSVTIQWDDVVDCGSGTPIKKLRLIIAYYLGNYGVGTVDFIPPNGFVGTAQCGKPAVLGFLDLQGFPALSDTSGVPKYASCVVDDTMAADTAGACTLATSGMKIGVDTNYGVTKVVTAKYNLDSSALSTYITANTGVPTISITLQVNTYLSPQGTGSAIGVNMPPLSITSSESNPAVVLYR